MDGKEKSICETINYTDAMGNKKRRMVTRR